MTRSSARSGWVVVFGAVLVTAWCGNQFSPLLLLYKTERGYSSLVVDAFLGVYVFGLIPALLLAGTLSDRFGRKPVMFVGVCCSAVAGVILALGVFGAGPLFVGRLLSGVAVGIAMSVGSSWLKELSSAPFTTSIDAGLGARRSSLAFTVGSASGAAVAGVISQFTPFGTILPFVIQVVVTLPLFLILARVPETAGPLVTTAVIRAGFRVPAASHRRFTRIISAAAPWLFAAAGVAYAYIPLHLSARSGGLGIGYATLLSTILLVTASLVQPIARRVDSTTGAQGLLVGLAVIGAGIVVAGLAIDSDSLVLGGVAALVLGAGMGIGLVSGLLEVQRLAPPQELAGLTGVFYAFAYAGFLAPTLLAALEVWFEPEILVLAVLIILIVDVVAIARVHRRHLPDGLAE